MAADCDVLISGAGPVGATLALALHAQGRGCQLVDAAPQPVQGDDRSLGLTTGSQRLLEGLGVWRHLRGAQPIRSLHISERGRFGRSHIHARDHGLDALGAVVPAQQLHDALAAELAARQIPLQRPAAIARMPLATPEAAPTPASAPCSAPAPAQAPGWRAVWLQQAAEDEAPALRARLVVGADGAQSAVRTALGIPRAVEDYGQVALVTQLDAARDPQGCAYERFDPGGPMAVLPRGGRRVGAIWMLPRQRAEAFAAGPIEDFVAAFQQAFGWRLGRLRAAAPLLRWPLSRVRARRLTGPRALLMGNAAAAFHPIAAQGFNLALRDAAALARALGDAPDPGADAVLAAYEASRQADHQHVERLTDGLVKLYTQDLPGLRQLRSLGLYGLEVAAPLQRRLVARSAGLVD